MSLNRILLLIKRFLKARELGFFFRRAKNFQIPKFINLNNETIKLDLPDEYGIKITFVEIFLDDTYRLSWIKKISKKNNINIKSILDIGGNCGLTSILLRSQFTRSDIHCYEPNPEILKYLKNNAHICNFNFYNQAVGNSNKMVKLKVRKNDSILSSISRGETGKINQISFEKAFERFKTDILDIVKMDCEGSEWEILENIEIWKKVRFLTMEYHLGERDINHDRILDALEKIGFSLVTKVDNDKKINYGMVLAYNKSLVSL